jgi:uncharacterized repeat protein (TIGR01451 family)
MKKFKKYINQPRTEEDAMKTLIKICSVFLLTLFASQVFAAIELKTVAEIEITKTDEKGKKKIKRTPATTVIPGTEVIYTITATNTGDKTAASISVKDPIPKEMIYVDDSAFGKNTVITFSVDGGKNYAKPEKLTLKDSKGKPRQATANDYTNIRWAFQFELKPKQSASVSFKARVK